MRKEQHLGVLGMERLWKTRTRFSFERRTAGDPLRYDCKPGRLDRRDPALVCSVISRGEFVGTEVFSRQGFREFVSDRLKGGDIFVEIKE